MADFPLRLPLLDQVRDRIRLRHYSIRTEQAYLDWIRRFILYQGKRHPAEMGAPEIAAFLTHLAVERNVAAATQNLARSALLVLYRDVLTVDLPWLTGVEQAKTPSRLPVVLTKNEVRLVLDRLGHRSPPSPLGPGFSARDAAGGARRRACKARHAAHATPFVCDALAGIRLRHSYGAGIVGPQRRQHDHDLHARAESRGPGGDKSP